MKAVLFDLGNTLAEYHAPGGSTDLIMRAVGAVEDYLRRKGLVSVSPEDIRERVRLENYESRNYRVRPLDKRLSRIFRISDPIVLSEACRVFLEPICRGSVVYPDVILALQELRQRGLKTAVVSNSPWGSSPGLWGKEIERLGLRPYFDALCFCGEVGWRKPAKPIFFLAMHRLGVEAADCLFVGDRPKWDISGPKAVGMNAVLIDRDGTYPDHQSIKDLRELLELPK